MLLKFSLCSDFVHINDSNEANRSDDSIFVVYRNVIQSSTKQNYISINV